MKGNTSTYGIASDEHEFGMEKKYGKRVMASFAPYVCEFVGTFMLAFTVGCCSLVGNAMWNPTAIASALMVAIYAVGQVSGGYLNPAVSITLGLCRKVSGATVLLYIIVQVSASLLACTLCMSMFGQTVNVGPSTPFTLGPVAVVEVVYTAMLCFVVANCVASERNNPHNDKNQFFALAIGCVMVAGGHAAGGVSGALFNPALAIGLDVTSLGDGIKWGFIYALFEILGAVIGALLYLFVRPEVLLSTPFQPLEDYVPPLSNRFASEFIGTFFLVFTVCVNIVMRSNMTAWSAAAALTCLVYSLGNVSGGHFNPAVSLAVVFSGRNKCKANDGCTYAVAQLLAAVVASLLVTFIHSRGPNSAEKFGIGPRAQYGWGEALCGELLFTFFLAYVVLAVATTRRPVSPSKQNFYFGLAIGSCICAGGFAIGAVSGGVMNPAVALGITIERSTGAAPADAASDGGSAGTTVAPNSMLDMASMVKESSSMASCLYYCLLQLIGGALAASVFHCTHPHEYAK